jgi:hypothetical protein
VASGFRGFTGFTEFRAGFEVRGVQGSANGANVELGTRP